MAELPRAARSSLAMAAIWSVVKPAVWLLASEAHCEVLSA
jgi:hypothetical protein